MSNADRQRRYRKRCRKGEGIAPVPYTDLVVAALIDAGRLRGEESEDRKQVGVALASMVQGWAESHLQDSVTRYFHRLS